MPILMFKCENGIKSDAILKTIVHCCLICHFVSSKYFELTTPLTTNVSSKLTVDTKEFLKNNNLGFFRSYDTFLGHLFYIFINKEFEVGFKNHTSICKKACQSGKGFVKLRNVLSDLNSTFIWKIRYRFR